VSTICARGVSVDLGGARVLDSVDVTVATGEWLSIVGPNGAGKSTLVRRLAGLVGGPGEVRLDGRPVDSLSPRDRARLVAVVPQRPLVPPGMTVAEYVLLGRTAHIPALRAESRSDVAAAARAVDQLDLRPFVDRTLDDVSGGERQRVFLARALAQDAPILLLDEPTTALDVGHQQEVLELVDRLRTERGLTVLTTMHDLTLAGQYADRLVLLDRGRVVVEGPAETVLTEENLSRYYRAHVRVLPGDHGPVVVPHRKERAT
jgi:iron complex transport system ATP-binding protein